jgi:simple sugar transport system ATP-binding protein
MSILEMKNISKSFNGGLVNDSIDLSVQKGEIHALLGENGAGKTTLMNILFGIYTADEGEIIWKNKSTHFHSPREAIENGIGMVHQHFSLVKKMTVLDNILLGLKTKNIFISRKKLGKDVMKLSQKYGLRIKPNARIDELSVGEQQRVEILKALFRNIELLILDEPTGVLTPEETKSFFDVLRTLKSEGYAVILITHRMSEIMEISDRVTIIRDGKKIKTIYTKETNPDELSYYMIGREISNSFDLTKKVEKKEVLKLNQITLKKHQEKEKLKDISLTVYSGEILGIAGVDGNGQKELAEVIAGISSHTEGNIVYKGKDISKFKVRDRFEEGISYISDDRQSDGLVLDMSIMDNLILREFRRKQYSKHYILNQKKIRHAANNTIEEYRIKTSGVGQAETPVKLLSGGNQQKIILAREIPEGASLIIANQPTRGLDIGATEFVRTTLLKKRNENKSVILISADLEEIIAISDRIAVMYEGKIMGILNREEADVQKIGLYMGGITGEV